MMILYIYIYIQSVVFQLTINLQGDFNKGLIFWTKLLQLSTGKLLATDANCFIPLKDHTPKMYHSSVVYEFKCPGCNANYVGKTDRCLYTRVKEHSCHDSSEIYIHICSCNEFNL